ncbi:transcriptional repressor, partial [Rhizobium ruizarguesonis]
MTDLAKTLEELCTERGMRMTEHRRVIARILEDSEDHPDVEELYRRSVKVDAVVVMIFRHRLIARAPVAEVMAGDN